MSKLLTGGCQCGRVRYSVEALTFIVYACHCRECQKQSASAFGLSLPVALGSLAIEGRLESWERGTDLGGWTRCFFCPTCGSPIYHASDGAPDRVTLKGGSLDDTSRLRPVAHLWVSRKQPWVSLDPSLPAHDTQPADFAAWRGALQGATG